MSESMLVRATSPDVNVMHETGLSWIKHGDFKPARVPASTYYRRRIGDGDLAEVESPDTPPIGDGAPAEKPAEKRSGKSKEKPAPPPSNND